MPISGRPHAATRSKLARLVTAFAGALVIAAGCASEPDVVEPDVVEPAVVEATEEQQQITRLEQELSRAQSEIENQSELIAVRETEMAALEERVHALQGEIATLESDAAREAELHTAERISLRGEISSLEQEIGSLQGDLERLARALEAAAGEAETERVRALEAEAELEFALNPPVEMATEAEIEAEREAAEILADARSGSRSFTRVPRLGFTNDRRLTNRLGVDETGLAVDSSGESAVLYDPSISHTSSLVYLSIQNPEEENPLLLLTVQYVSETRPIFAQTAFISIEGSDPLDPVDPILFSGTPKRDTDGRRIRESFTREVDRRLLTRISRMLSSANYSSTFVGELRETHMPSLPEREAMSRVLFAFIDLGGFR